MKDVQKVKIQELLQEVAGDALIEALKVAKPKYKHKTKEELAEIFGLTPFQFDLLSQKALGRVTSEKLEAKIAETLQGGGKSLEVPHQFNVFVHESKARQNENGTPARKLSIRTRQSMKSQLNR